jgi:hypothetical protein
MTATGDIAGLRQVDAGRRGESPGSVTRRAHPAPGARWNPAARRAIAAFLGVLIATGMAVAPPLASDVRAAAPDLTLVGAAQYDVDPPSKAVHVSVDLLATNHLHDTASRRFYFDRAYLPVMPGTTGFRLAGSSGAPSVAVARRRADYTLLQLNFGQQLFSGTSASFRLRFDLPDSGGAATRDVRIGASLVSFPVWAFATTSTPGASIAVSFPAGYTIDVSGAAFPTPTTEGGRVVYRSTGISDALSYFSYFVADRPGSYSETRTSATVNGTSAPLTIRAWPDDPRWARRVSVLFTRALPVIGELVGLPWERPQGLVVQEAVSRTTGGYAGLFDPKAGRIEVAYYADAFVILHEASHAWFNGALLADRWANEAFASYYAYAAAGRINEPITTDVLTPTLKAAKIPLNAWGAIGREQRATEDYAYVASLELAKALAQRAGQAGLRSVWAAAAAGDSPYQPVPHATSGAATVAPEKAASVPDWRGLLDLLEARTGKSYDDLWREWVVRDTEKPLLDARRTALTEYKAVVAEAGSWSLPRGVRDALRAWQFPQATQLLTGARAVLARRTPLEDAARVAALTLPARLQTVFETGDGFAAADAEVDAELAAIHALAAAHDARPASSGPLEQIGLIGETPDRDLAAARAAFQAGDVAGATNSAVLVRAEWVGAGEVGRNRILVTLGLTLLVLLALAAIASILRARRRAAGAAEASARPSIAPAAAAGSTRSATVDSPRAPPAARRPDDPFPGPPPG